MKLSELGLKSKPQTKTFTHGYVKYAVRNGELQYAIIFFKKKFSPRTEIKSGMVRSKEHLDQLMKLDAVEVQA